MVELGRSLESLEHRTLLAASINIDATGLLTYDTDGASTEQLQISVVEGVYTFASNQIIDIDSNLAGLVTTGDGTMLVTVAAPTGLTFNLGFADDELNFWNAESIADEIYVNAVAADPAAVLGVDTSDADYTGDWLLSVVDVEGETWARLAGLGADGVGSVNFKPSEIATLELTAETASPAVGLTVDFSEGNPLPAAGGAPTLAIGSGTDPSTASFEHLILTGVPESGPFDAIIHDTVDGDSGLIQIIDGTLIFRIEYTDLASDSIYDTVPAANYTFNYLGDADVGVRIVAGENSALTGNVQTLLITSEGAQFVDTYIANKSYVIVNQAAFVGGYMVTVDYGITTPVAGLENLAIVQSAGDDEAWLLDLVPDAMTRLEQGSGVDRAFLNLAGTAGTTRVSLDGGPDVDSLVIDAAGLAVSAANFSIFAGATVISGAPLPGGGVDYQRYESVVVTNVGPIVPTVYAVPIHAVEGQHLVDVLVGAFTASTSARASDFAATITWGDGTATAGVIVQDASDPSIYYVYGSHTYYEDGADLPASVTVVSLGGTATSYINGVPVTFITTAGDPVTTDGWAFVSDAPVTVSVKNFTGFENIPIATSDQIVVATFTDFGGVAPTDPDPASNYTATIYWGDGSAGVGGLTILRDGVSNTYIVTAAPHTYATPGVYAVTVVIADADAAGDGARVTGIATGTATIADAPLTATATQPTNTSVLENHQFVDWVIGSFDDSNPLATVDQFQVSIDWGDGSPISAGRVIQPGGVGTTFYVVGTHTYANSIAPGGHPHQIGPVATPAPALTLDGVYPLTMTVRDTYGSTVNLYNTLEVKDLALRVAGRLDTASDSGISNTDGVTNVNTPTFSGWTTEGGARVSLYGSLNGGAPKLIASTTADSTGAWSVTPGTALADGGYLIQAQAYDAFGHTISELTTIASTLVIDTVGPKVTELVFDNFRGQVLTTLQDFGGVSNLGTGLAASTVVDANNYRFAHLGAMNPNFRRFLVTSVTVTPGTATGEQVAAVQLNGGLGIRGGRYLFRALSVNPSNLTGIQDVAGNALDGEYYDYFPSGNKVAGGDFEARLDALHHTIFPPRSQVGPATPVSPPGRPATGRFLLRDGTLLPSAPSAVKLSVNRPGLTSARAARLAALNV